MLVQNIKSSNEEFLGQVAVVTGSSSGIGKAIASALASRAATVCLVGRNLDRLKKVAEDYRSNPSSVRCYAADLTRDRDIEELRVQVQKDFGNIDILIHSAGGISLGQFECVPVADFDWQYRINVRAAYSLTQAMLPLLKARRGQIVFLNSSAGLRANPSAAQYSATKHALKAIADGLRDEINPVGLRVLSVFLGRTATPMQAAVYAKEGRTYQPERLMQSEDVASVVINALSLPRTAEVTDISIRPLIRPS
jgi:NADP-dependent 3-hydroxy acid dehydrogenase YdfG